MVAGVSVNKTVRPPDFFVGSDRQGERAAEDDHEISSASGMAIRPGTARESRRRARDFERGYSINVKQVVLAFAVEFFIIGLILTGQYFIAAETANDKVFSILLFPIGLAVVELARVPLAIAVRTQNSWSVKFFAALGVAAAVTVTSFSLSTIAYQTFDPRLAEANEKNNALQKLLAERDSLAFQMDSAGQNVQEKIRARDGINDRYKELQSQISKISTTRGEKCSTTTTAEGETKNCSPTSVANAAQLRTLLAQLASTKKELDDAELALKVADAERARYDPRNIDLSIATARDDYRKAVARSQLHSYTSMIMRKSPVDVTDAEIKRLESYLIFIPSIAAALASTLLAITAVRRIRLRENTVANMPDEAAVYLFGPLVDAIKIAASDAVSSAMSKASGAADTKSHPTGSG
jgi:hypothetical protein